MQGVLLFLISFFLLTEVNWLNMLFITSETLLFKAVITPYLLYRIINKTGVSKVHKSALPVFYQLILTMFAFFVSIGIAFLLNDRAINPSFLAISISSMLCGLLLIITHKRIFSHMVGFLVLENAVFLFSIAAGTEMPILINTGILIDLVITTLILSVFLTKVNERNQSLEVDNLTLLKD
jgi:hydrogenase-4 component E